MVPCAAPPIYLKGAAQVGATPCPILCRTLCRTLCSTLSYYVSFPVSYLVSYPMFSILLRPVSYPVLYRVSHPVSYVTLHFVALPVVYLVSYFVLHLCRTSCRTLWCTVYNDLCRTLCCTVCRTSCHALHCTFCVISDQGRVVADECTLLALEEACMGARGSGWLLYTQAEVSPHKRGQNLHP